jgi:hypothetical protein
LIFLNFGKNRIFILKRRREKDEEKKVITVSITIIYYYLKEIDLINQKIVEINLFKSIKKNIRRLYIKKLLNYFKTA